MTKKKLERIKRDLSNMDIEAMSFDDAEGNECRDLLVSIARTCAAYCYRIKYKPERKGQAATDNYAQHRRAEQAAQEAKNPPRHEKFNFVGGGVKHTKVKSPILKRGD